MANEKRLIDANRIVEVAERAYNAWNLAMATADGKREINLVYKRQELCKAVKAVADDCPTVYAVEVVHGRWVPVPSSDMMTGKAYKCSECNKMRYGSFMPNYCQNCGAKMDGGVNPWQSSTF